LIFAKTSAIRVSIPSTSHLGNHRIAALDLWVQEVRICVKKAHAWAAEQLADLLRTISKVKTTQVARGQGQGCRDIELADFLADAAGPINFVSVGGVALTLCSTATSTIPFLLT